MLPYVSFYSSRSDAAAYAAPYVSNFYREAPRRLYGAYVSILHRGARRHICVKFSSRSDAAYAVPYVSIYSSRSGAAAYVAPHVSFYFPPQETDGIKNAISLPIAPVIPNGESAETYLPTPALLSYNRLIRAIYPEPSFDVCTTNILFS